MKPMTALIAMAAVALAACGQFGGNAVVPTPISPPTGALTAWASFPAEQRSVVVALALPLGGRVVVDGSSQATSVCPETKPDC